VPFNLLRTLSTTATYFRSPSLADITSEGLASFDQKQKEFRQRLADLQKKKDASQFRAVTYSSSTPTAPAASNASPQPHHKTTNSPSTSFTGAAASASTEDDEFETGRRKGTLSSLIYGTKEGREMDKEIEQSFSQVLARGKYVHSIVFHVVKPDKIEEYIELVGDWYPKIAAMPENKVHLVGSWRTEVGDCDTFGMRDFSSLFATQTRSDGPYRFPC
jgi:hypothetical protein